MLELRLLLLWVCDCSCQNHQVSMGISLISQRAYRRASYVSGLKVDLQTIGIGRTMTERTASPATADGWRSTPDASFRSRCTLEISSHPSGGAGESTTARLKA